MWSKPPRLERLFQSLTFRLTLTFGMLGYALIGLVSLFTHASVRYAIQAQEVRELSTTARVLLHRLEEDGEAPDKEFLDLGDHLSLRILDLQGRQVLASAGMGQKAPQQAFGATPEGAWTWSEHLAPGGASIRMLAVPFKDGSLQLARDVTDEDWMMHRLKVTLLWVFLLAPLAAGIAGYFLVRIGLRPLGLVSQILEGVKPETLRTRIEASGLPTELLPLAGSVNRALERLESAFGRLSQLNSDLAHELRSPVHALRLELEHLLAGGAMPAAAAESLAGMMEALDHLSTVIEQMLFLSRFEDPSHGLVKAELDAMGLLEAAAAPFEFLAEDQDIRLILRSDAGLRIRCDEVLVRRALHNLLANAIRHAPRGSEVEVEARAQGDVCLLLVKDAGPGIPPEMVVQIGRRFLRADASRTAKTGGTGLGLAIVQGIANVHGGSLEVQSGPGSGTVILIKLPRT